jgi:hypothetical protein
LWDINGCIQAAQCPRLSVISTIPTGFNVPDMSAGFGSALTYNFDPHWGFAEFDFGHNWGSGNYETTGSIGPRFIWRTDGANYFLHTLISLNRVSVSGLNAQNGIGAILGGGMDLPIKKWLAFRLFEADYVWGHTTTTSLPPRIFLIWGVLRLKASACAPVLFSAGVARLR